MGSTSIELARDLFWVIASVYFADFDDGGTTAILSSLANDEDVSRAVGEVPYEQKDHVSLCSNGEFNLNISCQQPAKAKEIMMDYNLITLHFLL